MDKDELVDTAIMVAHYAAQTASWAEIRHDAFVKTCVEGVVKEAREVLEGARDLRVL